MNGIKNGNIKFIASTNNGSYQYIKFIDNELKLYDNINGINIIGYNGIYIDKNITNNNGTLTFKFINNNIIFTSPSVYIYNNGIYGNIIFITSEISPKSIIINSLPSGIIASHLTSNITINIPIIINRSYNLHSEFRLYVGNMLSCISPSTGIKLQGTQSSSTIGATLNIESANIDWGQSTLLLNNSNNYCLIDTISSSSINDIIWLHPNCNNNNNNSCIMYLGNNNNTNLYLNYSLTNYELNKINSSSKATLYLGDRYNYSSKINIMYIDEIIFLYTSFIAKNIYFYSLSNNNGGGVGGKIIIKNNQNIFYNMNINLISNSDILFINNSSFLLNADSSNTLFIQTNKNCNNINNSSLSICNNCHISTNSGSIFKYYGGDLKLFGGYINSSNSSIILSERCSTTYSMAIGGITTPSDNNIYAMNILSSELSLLYSKNIKFDSYNGSIHISGFN